MNKSIKFIRRNEFHNSKEFKKINAHIDVCLKLIERLVKFNNECKMEVINKLNVDDYIIDFRIEQFLYFHEVLAGVYYGCYALKNVYETSTIMNTRKVETTIGKALLTQQRHVTLAAIVQMHSMFEFTRKEFEEKIKGKHYYEQVKIKYPKLGDSLELLRNFRNSIHTNGKWNDSKSYEYLLQSRKVILNKGDEFIIDHWTLYKIFKDCFELSKLLALDNEAKYIRNTRIKHGEEKVVVINTNMNFQELIEKLNDSK